MSIFKAKSQEEADQIKENMWAELFSQAENNPNMYVEKIDPAYNKGKEYVIQAQKVHGGENTPQWYINYLRFNDKIGWSNTPGQYYATTTYFDKHYLDLTFAPKFSRSIVIDGGSNWEINGINMPLHTIYAIIGDEVQKQAKQDFLHSTWQSQKGGNSILTDPILDKLAKENKEEYIRLVKLVIKKLILDLNSTFAAEYEFYKILKPMLLELIETNEKYKAKSVLTPLNEAPYYEPYDDDEGEDWDDDEEEEYTYADTLPYGVKEQTDYYFNKGKYSNEYEELYDEMVPGQGQSDSIQGEVLRCMSRLVHDRFNNGFGNPQEACAKILNKYAPQWTPYLQKESDWRRFYNWYEDIGFGETTISSNWIGDQYWDNIITAIVEWIMNSEEKPLPEIDKNMYG